jgi:hypothetical protein
VKVTSTLRSVALSMSKTSRDGANYITSPKVSTAPACCHDARWPPRRRGNTSHCSLPDYFFSGAK